MRIALLLLALAAGQARAQSSLTVGVAQEAMMTADGVHEYTMELAAGQFVVGEAVQHGADVVVTVNGPDGERVTMVDVTARGPDVFQFTTEAAGRYTVVVTPFERQEGRYEVVVRRAEPIATTPEGKVDQLVAAHDAAGRPGGVVAVIRGGEVEFVRAFGTAHLTHGVPVRPETVFNIGSVSKQFAGIFFAMMAEEGRLSLDDDVREYAPELPDFGPAVTLRHLLNHTSGYREVYGVLGMQGRSVAGDILERQDAIDVVRNQPALQFPPGSRHLYNSTAYVILTTIAERISGRPYPDWMQEHVFGPLGMTSTMIERVPGEVIPGSAYSYTNTMHGGYREDFESYAYYGATDVYTNVYDLARWMRNFRTSELGGPGVMRRMLERSVLAGGDTLDYTLGISRDRHLGMDIVQHGGATGGYRALLYYYPEIDAGVVAMANSGAVNIGEIVEGAAEAFFAEHARPEAEPDPPAAGAASAAAMDAAAGTFWAAGSGPLVLTRTESGLDFRMPGGRAGTLVPLDDSSFAVDHRVTLRTRGAAGGVMLIRGQGAVPFRRFDPAPAGTDLAAYAGRYFSEELETFYDVSVEDGALVLTHRRLGRIPLRPVARDLFAGPWPARGVEFARDAAGGVAGFSVTEGRSFGIGFRRVE